MYKANIDYNTFGGFSTNTRVSYLNFDTSRQVLYIQVPGHFDTDFAAHKIQNI